MLKGKKALIVGASRGIGEAIALCYAKEGADLVITGRNMHLLRLRRRFCPILPRVPAKTFHGQ